MKKKIKKKKNLMFKILRPRLVCRISHLKLNDYSIEITIPLFSRDIFLEIAILWNNYFLTKRNNYSSKK
jgi:hypothetical protein